jgi:2'-hydroxyisoflavone reductase
MVEAQRTGVFNADSVPGAVTMGQLLDVCRSVSGSDARVTWVGEQFLLDQKIAPWGEMPLWIPASDPESGGFFAVSVQRALEAGLAFRGAAETVRATLEWDRTRPGHPWRAGITAEREAELLSRWAAQPHA